MAMRGVKNMNLKTLLLASLLCLSLPFAAKADNVEIQQNQNVCTSLAECESSNINISNTETQAREGETENNTISQRTRRTRISQYAKDYYIGVGGALYFPDGGDVLFGGSVTGGIRFSPYVSGDADFIIGFGDFTLLGLLVGPKFEIGITETSDATAYISPGLGITYLDGDGASNTEFSFQIKTGVAFPAGENRVFGQGRYVNIDGGDIFSIEGGVFL
jgi:hypothetical protein